MIASIIIAVVLVVIAILLTAPSLLEFSFKWDENERKFSLKLRYLFFKKILFPSSKKKKTKPKKEKKQKKEIEKKKYTLSDVKSYVKKLRYLYSEIKDDIIKLLKYAKSHAVTIKKLETDIKFDTENPMNTGILTGSSNGMIYNIYSLLDRQVGIDDMSVSIVPLFENRNYFDIRLSGIIKIRNAHIIVIIIRVIPILLKLRKALKNNKF